MLTRILHNKSVLWVVPQDFRHSFQPVILRSKATKNLTCAEVFLPI